MSDEIKQPDGKFAGGPKKVEEKKDPTVIETLAAMSQNMQSLNMITEAHVQLFQQATVNFKDLTEKIMKLEERVKELENGRKV